MPKTIKQRAKELADDINDWRESLTRHSGEACDILNYEIEPFLRAVAGDKTKAKYDGHARQKEYRARVASRSGAPEKV